MGRRRIDLIGLAVALLASAVAPAGAQDAPPTHVPPVPAAVADPFRAPATQWSAGNRGIEYDTEPGAQVRATADGVVVFAGPVAGSRHITVEHADGIRTTYSFLDRIEVVVGQRVEQGDAVGTTVGHLHLGARRGDAYFDPATLFGAVTVEVHLVPFDEPPGLGEMGERSAISQLVGGVGGLLDGAEATVDWLRDNGSQLARTAAHYLEPTQVRVLRRGVAALRAAWEASRRGCTDGDVLVPPLAGRRVALLVGGLGSTSDDAAIDDVDTASLGYDDGDVLRFSYEGGRTPGSGAAFEGVEARAYGPGATQRDLRETAGLLADLVEQVVDDLDGVEVDLMAHSQGGLVVRLALVELERRHGRSWLDHLGVVATLGTPHGGADLATAVHAIGSTGAGSLAFDVLQGGLGLELDDDGESVAQLAETSEVVRDLADHPIPKELRAVSIAARGDLVVPVPRTSAPGATQVVVPLAGLTAHDALPGSAAATRELALALAGRPPSCRSFGSALLDQAAGEGISLVEDEVGRLGWYAALGSGQASLGG